MTRGWIAAFGARVFLILGWVCVAAAKDLRR